MEDFTTEQRTVLRLAIQTLEAQGYEVTRNKDGSFYTEAPDEIFLAAMKDASDFVVNQNKHFN